MKKQKEMTNHIEEYFLDQETDNKGRASKELFTAEDDDVDIKTDLSWKEIVLINKLLWNNKILTNYGIEPVFNEFLIKYMRLKISLDRKSRSEFVSVNQENKADDILQGFSSAVGLQKDKQ